MGFPACAHALPSTAVVEVGHDDANGLASGAREVWSTLRTADLRYPPSVLADKRIDSGPVDDRCKLCRSPVLWVSVGAAVALGTVVTVVLLSGSQSRWVLASASPLAPSASRWECQWRLPSPLMLECESPSPLAMDSVGQWTLRSPLAYL